MEINENIYITDNELVAFLSTEENHKKIKLNEEHMNTNKSIRIMNCEKIRGFLNNGDCLLDVLFNKFRFNDIYIENCSRLNINVLKYLRVLFNKEVKVVFNKVPNNWHNDKLYFHYSVVYPNIGLIVPDLKVNEIGRMSDIEIKDHNYSHTTFVLILMDGRIACAYEFRIEIYDLHNDLIDAELRVLNEYNNVRCMEYKPTGNQLISVYGNKTIRIWCLTQYKQIGILTSQDNMYSLCILPNERLASGSDDKIIIWDLNKYERIKSIVIHQNVFSYNISYLTVTENKIISKNSSVDKDRVRIWDINDLEEVYQFNEDIKCFYHPTLISKNRIAIPNNNEITIWDISNSNLNPIKIATLPSPSDSSKDIQCIEVISNGMLLSASVDGYLTLWDIRDLNQVRRVIRMNSQLKPPIKWHLKVLPNGNCIYANKFCKIYEYSLFESIINSSSTSLTFKESLLFNARQLLIRNQFTENHIPLLFSPNEVFEFDFSNTCVTDELFKAIIKYCPLMKFKMECNTCGFLSDQFKCQLKAIEFAFWCSKSNIFVSRDITDEIQEFYQ